MSKPIFVLQVKENYTLAQRDKIMSYLDKIGFYDDYYFFMLNGCNEPKAQIFSDKEIEPIELEKLQKLVNETNKR